jgi:hypothetical protein
MSVHQRRDNRERQYRVSWRQDGKRRSRAFSREADAHAFDLKIKARLRERKRLQDLREAGPAAKLRQQVYVIGTDEHVKIGFTANPRRRLSGFQTASPAELTLFYLIDSPDAAHLEAALHVRYAQHRRQGEWFDAAPVLADLAELAELGAHEFLNPAEVSR